MRLVTQFRRIDHIFEYISSSSSIMILLILLFGLILRLAHFSGITGGDDMIYAYNIYKFSIGNFEPGTSHWDIRLAFLLPISLFVRIFGYNEFALALFPLICSMANIFLIYSLAKLLFTERIALYAAFLLSFFPLEVIFATMIFGDMVLALFMGLVVFYFLKGETQNNFIYYLLSGLCVGMAYLTKETGTYIIFFLIGYALIEKKIKLQYGLVILSFLAIFFVECGYYYLKTGDPLYHFSVLTRSDNKVIKEQETGAQVNVDTSFFKFKRKSVRDLKVLRGKNWFVEPIFTFTTEQEFGFFYYFILPITIYLLIKKDPKVKILLIWMIPLLIYILYGSISPFHFQPLRRWPRYLSPLTFPALMLLAYFLNENKHWLWKKFSVLTTSFLLATSLICIFAFDSGPTDSYIVKKIAAFREQNSQKSVLVYWEMYQHLAPFLEYQKNQNIQLYGLPENKARPEGSLYYGIELADPDKARDCYIVIPLYYYEVNIQNTHPNWKLIHSIIRPKRFYCPFLERLTFIPNDVKEKLCPNELCEIYYIP
jgi:4-amino-4-deoxy-L-arabinose transferase-like glycosyltransferase